MHTELSSDNSFVYSSGLSGDELVGLWTLIASCEYPAFSRTLAALRMQCVLDGISPRIMVNAPMACLHNDTIYMSVAYKPDICSVPKLSDELSIAVSRYNSTGAQIFSTLPLILLAHLAMRSVCPLTKRLLHTLKQQGHLATLHITRSFTKTIHAALVWLVLCVCPVLFSRLATSTNIID